MSAHTPGPWSNDHGIEITAGHKSICGMRFPFDSEEHQANARRIVACVNACEGFSTDFLEKIRFDTAVMRSQAAMAKALFRAEAFIAGFEGDELQEGVDELLAEIRAAQKGGAA